MTALVAAGLMAGPIVLPSASAKDLEDKQDKVEGQIHDAKKDLNDSAEALEAATAKLVGARKDLATAEAYLSTTRTELAAAEALDREMQSRLDAAIERLNRAQLAVDESKAEFEAQESLLRQMVVSSYEQGDPALMGLSMIFTTQNPALLAGKLNADETVIDVETTILDQLEAGEVLLEVKEAELAEAKADVAVKRQEAAANLRRKTALELQAREAKQQVAQLVVARRDAMAVALKAKKADLAQIAKLEAEQNRIAQLIAQRTKMTSVTGFVDGNGALAMPVDGYVSSPYGWRIHPIWGYRALHDGVDIAAACGTPIRAAADGVVISEYFNTAWGNRMIIDHGVIKGVGVTTVANHMSGYAVPTGARVERGQVVGYVGTTGWSTGCHVHYTVNQNGVPVDPMNWF